MFAPPVVVFGAQLEVAQDDGDLGAGDDENDKDEAEEAKEVVELVEPHGGQDEEELDEDSPKWQDASHQDAEHRVHVPCLHQSQKAISEFKPQTHFPHAPLL